MSRDGVGCHTTERWGAHAQNSNHLRLVAFRAMLCIVDEAGNFEGGATIIAQVSEQATPLIVLTVSICIEEAVVLEEAAVLLVWVRQIRLLMPAILARHSIIGERFHFKLRICQKVIWCHVIWSINIIDEARHVDACSFLKWQNLLRSFQPILITQFVIFFINFCIGVLNQRFFAMTAHDNVVFKVRLKKKWISTFIFKKDKEVSAQW